MSKSILSRRFFSDESLKSRSQQISLSESESRHLVKTLRLKEGDSFLVIDTLGFETTASITMITDGIVQATLLEDPQKSKGETLLPVHLVVGFAKKGLNDEVVEKAQELGAASYRPVICEYGLQAPEAEKTDKMLGRWRKKCIAAAKQSGQLRLLEVLEPETVKEALKGLEKGTCVLLCHPYGEATRLQAVFEQLEKKEVVSQNTALSLWIGPEGGFSEGEVGLIKSASLEAGLDFYQIELGTSLLRMETAVVAVLGAVQFFLQKFK